MTHKDKLHLQAAEGWLELGDLDSAANELEEIAPELREHPHVLVVRMQIYLEAKRWENVVIIANTLVRDLPELREPWIHRSYALHELKRTQEAYDNLLPVAERFPDVWTIPYNLACYTAQLGRIEEAAMWFEKAKQIDPDTVQRAASDDPDLAPLFKGE